MANSTAPPIPAYTPSTIILNGYSQLYVDKASVMIAPWIMGTLFDFFLQGEYFFLSVVAKANKLPHLTGIIASQTVKYFTYRDPTGENSHRRFTWLVIVLTIFCLLKSAQNVYIVWIHVITNFANPDMSSMLIVSSWVVYTTSLSTGIIATFVQAFFAYRYWLLTRRWYISLLMVVGMVVSLVASILVIVYIPQNDNPSVKTWSLVHFVSAICVDLMITVFTAVHLHQQKTSIQSTADMIDRLIRMTFESALPPTIFVILNAIVLETLPITDGIAHLALNMVLSKLYAVSLLYTLNLRNTLRTERMTSYERSTNSRSHGQQLSVGGGGKRSFLPSTNDATFRGRSGSTGGQRGPNGVSIIGHGKGLGYGHGARRVDGVHIETHVSTHGGSSGNTMELQAYGADGVKSLPGEPSDFDREVWEPDTKYGRAQ